MLILLLSSWQAAYQHDKMAKCVQNALKSMVVDRKNQKALALLYLASKLLRKAANTSGVPTEFATEPTRQIWTFRLNFIAYFFRLNWTFLLPRKRQLSILLNFSFNKFVFDFCCLCLFCYNAGNMRFRAKNTGLSTGLYQVYATSYWWPCGADGRTGDHVTITSLPKSLGLIGYQISLAMVLCWRASARAPLLFSTEPSIGLRASVPRERRGAKTILKNTARWYKTSFHCTVVLCIWSGSCWFVNSLAMNHMRLGNCLSYLFPLLM